MNNFLKIALFFLISFSLHANSGKISGKVTDSQTGEPLIGVNIIIEGTQIGAATDIDGFYFIINLRPNNYTLIASYVGYEKTTISKIDVKSDLTTKVDFQMYPQTISTSEVVVTAKKPPIQKDLTSSQQNFSVQDIENAPIDNLEDLLIIQAGVSPIEIAERPDVIEDSPGDGLHVRGGRENETAFLIDGIRVDNPIWGGSSFSQSSSGSAFQEVSTTLGTFNAEYGGKMSGIINLITKDGTDKFSAKIDFDTDNFGIPEFNRNTFNTEFSLSGPLIFDNISFFTNLQLNTTDGRFLGYEIPNWTDLKGQLPISENEKYEVPVDWEDEFHGLVKLTWRILPQLRLMGSYIISDIKELKYKHEYKYLPSGLPWSDTRSEGITFSLTHQLSNSTYYEIIGSKQNIGHFLGLHKIREQRLLAESGYEEDIYGFSYSGAYSNQWRDTVETYEGKINLTSQLNNTHLLKAGFGFRTFDLFHLQDHAWTTPTTEIVVGTDDDGNPITQIFEDHKSYNNIAPKEYSAFIQDKMEFNEIGMIINLGLRWEQWNLPLQYMQNPELPLETKMLDVKPKNRLSPRLGLSYPISDKAAFHFAYGHFYQFPSYVNFLTGVNQKGEFGDRPNLLSVGLAILNPNMKPEKSITYEAGVQASVVKGMTLNVTTFYRELADLIGVTWIKNAGYVYYDNVDFGNVKGVEVIVDNNFTENFSARFNYTFSQTLISTSSPLTASQSIGTSSIAYRTDIADWDRPHDLSLYLRYSIPDIVNISLSGRAKSGRPYTVLAETPNTERMPWNINFDMKISKKFKLFGLRETVFLKVYNLFDRQNIYNVYSVTGAWDDDGDSGTPYASDANPKRISDGRRIRLGFTVEL